MTSRVLAAIFTVALLGYLLHAMVGRMGVLAGATAWGLWVCAAVLFANVLIAMADSPEEPR